MSLLPSWSLASVGHPYQAVLKQAHIAVAARQLHLHPPPPASDGLEGPIPWRNCDLMYLACILQAEEVTTSNPFIFTPSLEELDHATFPIHVQLYKRATTSIPPGLEAHARSKYAPIGTGRLLSCILIAESSYACRTPFEARRSLAYALLSNYAVNAEIDKRNVLYSLHCTPIPALESMLRAMYLMKTIPDVEWTSRLAQFRGMLHGKSIVPGVSNNCTLEARIEVYLLAMGRACLDGWIKCVAMCLGFGDDARSAWAQVYGDVASFLVRARDGLWGKEAERVDILGPWGDGHDAISNI